MSYDGAMRDYPAARAAADDALREAGLGVPERVLSTLAKDATASPHCAKHPRYSVVPFCPDCRSEQEAASGGGKLSGAHYYRVDVRDPMSPEVQAYTAECADIIEALGMTFNEGEAFKALWRLAAARQGRVKAGNKLQYDADKVAHYGARVAVQTKRGAP